jgi:hypothetical protein
MTDTKNCLNYVNLVLPMHSDICVTHVPGHTVCGPFKGEIQKTNHDFRKMDPRVKPEDDSVVEPEDDSVVES